MEKSEWGLEDRREKENQSKKGLEKDQPSSSVMKKSQSLFKMEAKFNIKSYHGDIYALNLKHYV